MVHVTDKLGVLVRHLRLRAVASALRCRRNQHPTWTIQLAFGAKLSKRQASSLEKNLHLLCRCVPIKEGSCTLCKSSSMQAKAWRMLPNVICQPGISPVQQKEENVKQIRTFGT